jgi:hypothetical protein
LHFISTELLIRRAFTRRQGKQSRSRFIGKREVEYCAVIGIYLCKEDLPGVVPDNGFVSCGRPERPRQQPQSPLAQDPSGICAAQLPSRLM